jgi:hypothetical protein
MTQPTFADGPPVPLMVEGVIDADTLRHMFAELVAAATVLGIREKGDPAAYSEAEALTTETAMVRLLSGAARAVQLRYQFGGHEWADTILVLPGGFRVVRCRFDSLA